MAAVTQGLMTKASENGWGFEHGVVLLNWADDLVLTAKNDEEMTEMVAYLHHALEEFKLSWVELWIGNHISEKGNTLSGISSMKLNTESGEFSIRMSFKSSTHVINGFGEIVL